MSAFAAYWIGVVAGFVGSYCLAIMVLHRRGDNK
jgi:hypothetical protein